jgi:hypothetical protein
VYAQTVEHASRSNDVRSTSKQLCSKLRVSLSPAEGSLSPAMGSVVSSQETAPVSVDGLRKRLRQCGTSLSFACMASDLGYTFSGTASMLGPEHLIKREDSTSGDFEDLQGEGQPTDRKRNVLQL